MDESSSLLKLQAIAELEERIPQEICPLWSVGWALTEKPHKPFLKLQLSVIIGSKMLCCRRPLRAQEISEVEVGSVNSGQPGAHDYPRQLDGDEADESAPDDVRFTTPISKLRRVVCYPFICLRARWTSVKLVLLIAALVNFSIAGIFNNLSDLVTTVLGVRIVSSFGVASLGYSSCLSSLLTGILADRWFGSLLMVKIGVACSFLASSLLWICVVVQDHDPQSSSPPAWMEFCVFLAITFLWLCGTTLFAPIVVLGVNQHRKRNSDPAEAYGFFPFYFWWVYIVQLLAVLTITVLEDAVDYFYGLLICAITSFAAFVLLIIFHDTLSPENNVRPVKLTDLGRALWNAVHEKLTCKTRDQEGENMALTADTGKKWQRAQSHHASSVHDLLIRRDERLEEAAEEVCHLLHLFPLLPTFCFIAGFLSLVGAEIDSLHMLSVCMKWCHLQRSGHFDS